MKNVFRLVAILCCLSLAVACGEGNGNGDGDGDGDGPGAGATFCLDTCEDVSDCPNEEDYECNEVCEFVGEVEGCDNDGECVAQFSGWMDTCEAQDECTTPGQVCVDFDGQGYCAMEETDIVGCDTMSMDSIELRNIEDDEDVTVCGNSDAQCGDDGQCFAPQCEEDTDCDDNEACYDGYCGCANDDACEDDEACYDGFCGCANDESCEDVDNADTCYDGFCGCSSGEVCGEDQICTGF